MELTDLVSVVNPTPHSPPLANHCSLRNKPITSSPRTLPCGHAYCFHQCLQQQCDSLQFVGKAPPCPACGKELRIADDERMDIDDESTGNRGDVTETQPGDPAAGSPPMMEYDVPSDLQPDSTTKGFGAADVAAIDQPVSGTGKIL